MTTQRRILVLGGVPGDDSVKRLMDAFYMTHLGTFRRIPTVGETLKDSSMHDECTKKLMQDGELMPDHTAIEAFNYLFQFRFWHDMPFIVVGFPRTVAQAEHFITTLSAKQRRAVFVHIEDRKSSGSSVSSRELELYRTHTLPAYRRLRDCIDVRAMVFGANTTLQEVAHWIQIMMGLPFLPLPGLVDNSVVMAK